MLKGDFLTILTCVPGKRAAKLYHAIDEKPSAFDAGFLFSVEQVPIASLAELADALDGLRSMPECMVIRDQLRADAKAHASGLYPRRRVDRPSDPAPFEHCEHRWACFDADKTATAFDAGDPVGSVERWKESLPPALAKAKGLFHFSASQHLHDTVRGHLWIWLAEPAGNVELARWAIRNGFDPALFHAVQPHYTADPVFAPGLVDPLAPRELVWLPGEEAVDLEFTVADLADRGVVQSGGVRLGSIHLAEVGDPSEEGAEARERIAKQLAEAFAGPGKRWDLCGHIGGACANVGAPPEECCAVLELLRAGDVPDHEFRNGLQWALGAYSFSARPKGIKGIAELCGAGVADRVEAWLKRLAGPAIEEAALEATVEAVAVDWGGLPFDTFSHNEDPPAIPYIIPALEIGPGKPTGVVGYAYSSKTPFGLELAVCTAMGADKFQGHAIAYSTRVLYIASEGARNARRKAARIAIAHGTTLAEIGARLVIVQAPPGFLTIESAEAIGAQADAGGFGLVIVDTYNSAFDGSKDRNSNDFSQALKVFGDISDRAAVTFVALLHCRKGTKETKGRAPTLQEIDGHNSIAGALQCAVGLWRPDPDDKTLIAVECVRAVDDGFDRYCIEWADTPAAGSTLGLRSKPADMPADKAAGEVRADREATDRERIWAKTLLLLKDKPMGITGRDHERAGMGGASVAMKSRVLAEMVEAGAVVETSNEFENGFRYTLATGAKAAEARQKHSGFLAGGEPGKKKKGGGGKISSAGG